MAENWEGEQEEVPFELRDIVWAKIIGYPWWPARVTQVPTGKSINYRVDFFCDHTQYLLVYAVPSCPRASSTHTKTCARRSICIAPSIRAFGRL